MKESQIKKGSRWKIRGQKVSPTYRVIEVNAYLTSLACGDMVVYKSFTSKRVYVKREEHFLNHYVEVTAK